MGEKIKGRGTQSSPPGRFERQRTEAVDDGWWRDEVPESIATSLQPEAARSIITRNDSPDVPFEQSINPYRGCEHGCSYCGAGETEVLMADGSVRALGDLRVGDEIIGTERRGHYRRYTRTRLLDHWAIRKPAYRVTLEDGTELVTSGDHRLLTERGWEIVARPCGGECRSLAGSSKLLGFGTVPPAGRNLTGGVVASRADLRVVEVESLGFTSELFDITTGTGDYVANGVISHNCFARPSHSYVGLSPGLDFETRLFYKPDAARLLEKELARPGYVCRTIAMGTNTDPYQPVEKKLGITRQILEVLARCRHPVSIVTKGALVERDIDLLADLARDRLAHVILSITTLDPELKRTLEPRAASPEARLRALRCLAEAGVPVGVLVAPIIPAINDGEIESILEAAARAGAKNAGHVLLRLPHEVKDLFREWLETHRPERAQHVMSLVRQMRGGRENDPCFGSRMSGQGPFAELIRQRFVTACRRFGLEVREHRPLATALFRPPGARPGQLGLEL
jgi:DNA repair photolyase